MSAFQAPCASIWTQLSNLFNVLKTWTILELQPKMLRMLTGLFVSFQAHWQSRINMSVLRSLINTYLITQVLAVNRIVFLERIVYFVLDIKVDISQRKRPTLNFIKIPRLHRRNGKNFLRCSQNCHASLNQIHSFL